MTATEIPAAAPLRLALWSGAVMLAGVLAWAALVPLATAITLPGLAEPAGPAATIATDRPGRVSEVMVTTGARVSAGQPLVRLDPGSLAEERQAVIARIRALEARLGRIAAETGGTRPPRTSDAERREAGLHAARQAALSASLAAIAAREAGLDAQQDALDREARALARERALIATEIARQSALIDQGLAAEPRRSALQLALARLEGSEANLQTRLAALQDTRTTLAAERKRLILDTKLAGADAVAELGPDLEAARIALADLDARLAALTLRAPIDGLVTDMATAAGDIALPDRPLLRILAKDGLRVRVALPVHHRAAMFEGDMVSIVLHRPAAMPVQVPGIVTLIHPAPHRVHADAAPAFTVEITPKQDIPLHIGEPVTVSLSQTRRTALALLAGSLSAVFARAPP